MPEIATASSELVDRCSLCMLLPMLTRPFACDGGQTSEPENDFCVQMTKLGVGLCTDLYSNATVSGMHDQLHKFWKLNNQRRTQL